MSSTTPQLDDILQSLAALRQELGQLSARIEALEAKSKTASAVASAPPATIGLSEELIAVISAAIAAFLGEKPRIRQIRLLGSASWGQQGRATIQASHAVSPRHN
jgi:hypothetical protein